VGLASVIWNIEEEMRVAWVLRVMQADAGLVQVYGPASGLRNDYIPENLSVEKPRGVPWGGGGRGG
jgi:hypothetical protein